MPPVWDVEEAVRRGKENRTCAYQITRDALVTADIVLRWGSTSAAAASMYRVSRPPAYPRAKSVRDFLEIMCLVFNSLVFSNQPTLLCL